MIRERSEERCKEKKENLTFIQVNNKRVIKYMFCIHTYMKTLNICIKKRPCGMRCFGCWWYMG